MAEINDNISQHRFELTTLDGAIASVYYRMDADTVVLIHTEVPFEHSGEGLATQLATGVFTLLRKAHRRAEVRCDFMGRFIAGHPEFSDVLAH